MKKLIPTLLVLLFVMPAHAAILLEDDFEYSVARTGTAADAFMNTGPWGFVKAENATEGSPGALGYLSTETSIPGFSGSFPGTSSTYVLRMAALPVSSQTDFYLQWGDGTSNKIPADVWFQFWIYSNHYGSELGELTARNKFIYPCFTSHPCAPNWLFTIGSHSHEPYNYDDTGETGAEGTYTSDGHFYLIQRDAVGPDYSLADSGNESKVGQNLSTDVMIRANNWYLVKLHYDTGNSTGNSFEAWITPQGGSTTKVAEWIGGETANFTWDLASPGGHGVFKMPTTFPSNVSGGYNDAWIYMDDFVMAESESDLPVYGGTGSTGIYGNFTIGGN